MSWRLIVAIALAAATVTAEAASVSVADGDSFRMDGQRYRLHDIDAPELHQTCNGGRATNCAGCLSRGR
jgi:endonuclease YncB( thermonuclease family)